MRRTLAGFAVVLLTACSLGQQTQVDAAKELRQAASNMAQLHTLSATLKFTKAPISFEGFALVGAKTAVQLPSVSDTQYTVKEQDISIGIEIIINESGTWLRVPFSTFRKLTGTEAAAVPDISKLFNATTGLPAVIPNGASPRYVSTDQIEGKDAYQISTSYTADQVRGLLEQLNSSGPVNAKIWVGASDSQIHKAILDGPFGDDGKEASVEVNITNFNGTVSITSPTP